MKKILLIYIVGSFFPVIAIAQVGKVGINTTTPSAVLHVKDSSVVFTGLSSLPASPGNPPVSNAGTRFMWYPDRAALRSGRVLGTEWNKENVGAYSVAFGDGCMAKGAYSIAFHINNIASGVGALAYGSNSIAAGTGSVSGGFNTKSNGFASTVIGMYNDTIVGPQTTVSNTTPLFIIGNGASGTLTNAMTVLKNGKVGISTSSPSAQLHVKDSSVVFTGLNFLPVSPGNPPVTGSGIRMMWYPDKAAFRVGRVTATQWDKVNVGNYSFASGYNCQASGVASGVFGQDNIVSGSNAFAVGEDHNVSGLNAFAAGQDNTVTGGNAFTSGRDNVASNANSMAIGVNNTSSGSGSIAIGSDCIASGTGSLAIGKGSQASDTYSMAFGHLTTSSNLYSMSMGTSTHAAGNSSSSLGWHTQANGFASTVLGMYNDTIVAVQNSATSTTPLFIIGNGTGSVPSNALTVLKNGNIGIGTTTPGFPITFPNTTGDKISLFGQSGTSYGFGVQNNLLQIHTPTSLDDIAFGYGSSAALTETMRIKANGNVGIGTNTPGYLLDINGRMRIRSGGNNSTSPGLWLNKIDNTGLACFIGLPDENHVGIFSQIAGSWQYFMDLNNGEVGIGTFPSQKLHVNGNGLFNGTVTASCGVLVCSDIRYKTNIRPLTHSLANVLMLNGIYYEWQREKFKDKAFNDKTQIGFSAQEIEKIYPEMIHTDADGYKSVDYSRLTPVLVEAIKEQQAEIEELKGRLMKVEEILKMAVSANAQRPTVP